MLNRASMTIVGFGDSITQASTEMADPSLRWLGLVESALRTRYPRRAIKVVNAGVGGNTSREGLARMERDVIPYSPDLVLVQFGGNDATREPDRHVELREFTANLESIRWCLAQIGAGVIVLTFPPVIDVWHTWGRDEFYRPAGGIDWSVEPYREATRRLSAEWNAPLVDIDQALRDAMRREGVGTFILPDGVHLTAAGNRVVAEAVTLVLWGCIAE